MSEIPPIGLPNLVSQGDLVARVRAAVVGAERAGNDTLGQELQRLADLRAEQVQRAERVQGTSRERRERQQQEDPHSRYDRGDDPDDSDDGEHALDVTA